MRTDATYGKGHGIPFHDGEVRLVVFLVFNMMYIFGDIDLSRAGLTARSKTISTKIDMQNSIRRFAHLHDPLGAGLFAGPAAHAFFHVNHRKTLWAQFKGVKQACPHTASKTQTTRGALLGPGIKHGGCPAILHTHIIVLLRCPKSASTGVL
jgi:hypothetical protein